MERMSYCSQRPRSAWRLEICATRYAFSPLSGILSSSVRGKLGRNNEAEGFVNTSGAGFLEYSGAAFVGEDLAVKTFQVSQPRRWNYYLLDLIGARVTQDVAANHLHLA